MRRNLGYKRFKMSNDGLENILLIKINGPVLRKIHKNFDNFFESNRSLLSKKEMVMEPTYYKRRESNQKFLFGPPIK